MYVCTLYVLYMYICMYYLAHFIKRTDNFTAKLSSWLKHSFLHMYIYTYIHMHLCVYVGVEENSV